MGQPSSGKPGSGGSSSVSSTLLARLKAADSAAWQRFVKLYGPTIYGWCRQSQVQPVEASDIVQEVFRAVLTGIQDFRRQEAGDSFRGWLWTITRNKLRDHIRRRSHRPEAIGGSAAQQRLQQVPDLEPAAEPSPDADSLAHRALALVRQEFEDVTWQAFWQVVVEDRAAREVGRDLGMSPGAVRQAKYRVLRRLRQELADKMV